MGAGDVQAMPASLLQLQRDARAPLRRALRSGHVAALGPCRGARAMLLRSGPRLRLLRCVAVLVVFPLVLRLVCAGLFAMGHIGIQGLLEPSRGECFAPVMFEIKRNAPGMSFEGHTIAKVTSFE